MKTKRMINMKNGKTSTNTFNKTVKVNSYKNVNPRLKYPKGNAGPECKPCTEDLFFVVNTDISLNPIWNVDFSKGDKIIAEDITFSLNSSIINGIVLDYITEDCKDNTKINVSLFVSSEDNIIPNKNYSLDLLAKKLEIKTITKLSSSSIIRNGAPFRAPLAGYRRALVTCTKNENMPTNTVYGDSLSMADPKCRYNKQICSGMQPKKNTCGKAYSFSYSEYNKNRALNTYERGLEHNKRTDDKFFKSSGSACDTSCSNINNVTVWKPNNKKFNVQGAVSSSSRIDRLKLETLRAANIKK